MVKTAGKNGVMQFLQGMASHEQEGTEAATESEVGHARNSEGAILGIQNERRWPQGGVYVKGNGVKN